MAESVRVLRVIARMNVGGPAWQSSVLTRGLPAYGIETRLLAGRVGVDEEDFVVLRDPDLPVTIVEGLGRSVRVGGDLRAFAALVREIREFRPDIIHTHTAKAGVLGRLAAIVCRVPVRVHTFHGHLLRGYFSSGVSQLVRLAERVLARQTTALVSVGRLVRDELVAAGIGRSDQWTPIAPGVAPSDSVSGVEARRATGLPVGAPVVLFVGRLTAVKRFDRLLEAFGLVLQEVPEALLVVVGQGEEIEKVLLAAAPFGESVRLLGWRSDLANLYGSADVVVISSDNEGMPVTLIEAAMAGVPGVTTNAGSASEVVEHGVTGLVVDLDGEKLAQGIVELLQDHDRRRNMGEAAARRAKQRFGSERLVLDHVGLYRSLLEPQQP